MHFLSIEELLNQKKEKERLLLLVRHAERFSISADDPDYGLSTLLTPLGKGQAEALGEKLKVFSSAAYWSSPVMRCLETGAFIAKGRGDDCFTLPEQIPVLESLGGHFVADPKLFESCMRENFFDIFTQYLGTGLHPAFFPLADSAETLFEQMINLALQEKKELSIFISHDAWIVSMLSYFLKMSFSVKQWMNFLSGMAIWFTDKGKMEIYPFTALEKGYVSFAF